MGDLGLPGHAAKMGNLGLPVALASLDFGENLLGEGGKALAEALPLLTSLTSLKLRMNNFGAAPGADVMRAVCTLSALTALNMEGNAIGAPGSKVLAKALLQIPDLASHLNLSANALGSAEGQLPDLVHLNLSANALGPSEVEQLGGALATSSSLKELFLAHNSSGAGAAAQIVHVIQSVATLTSLDVRGNRLGSEGCTALVRALESRPDVALSLEEHPRSVDWSQLDVRIPDEVLDKGWAQVLEYFRSLAKGSQQCFQLKLMLIGVGEACFQLKLMLIGVGEACFQLKLMLIGVGEAGKTSLQRALRSPTGKTSPIRTDQRTIGVFRPDGHTSLETSAGDVITSAKDVQTSAEDVLEARLTPWLSMIHAHVPSAHVVIACTRWETPPEGMDLEEHQAHAGGGARVSALAEEVGRRAGVLVERFNASTAAEAKHIQAKLEEAGQARAAEGHGQGAGGGGVRVELSADARAELESQDP
ncbi:hypothetical protein T484DRAFT_1817074 [Baffinella frigidus]|nr:hypothetical protein T484DRAFT_1817074 [Cryptophyta sp. CCMP2293]